MAEQAVPESAHGARASNEPKLAALARATAPAKTRATIVTDRSFMVSARGLGAMLRVLYKATLPSAMLVSLSAQYGVTEMMRGLAWLMDGSLCIRAQ